MQDHITTPVRAFLEVVTTYNEALAVPDTTTSARIFGDSKKIVALRRGETDLTTARLIKGLRKLQAIWPERLSSSCFEHGIIHELLKVRETIPEPDPDFDEVDP